MHYEAVTGTNGTAVGLVGADPHTRRQRNDVNPCPVLPSCSRPPNRYYVFGLPWPIYSVPSLACLANQSQGGHYHGKPIHATNRFQERLFRDRQFVSPHSRSAVCLRIGRRPGPGDHLITWTRPQKPAWMSQEQYDRIPETLTLREVKFCVTVPGRRTGTITIITTLTNPKAYSREDLAELYGFRWNVELDIRQIKQTLHVDHVRCKTPQMVRRELWVTVLAYNLIRKVIATSAAVHGKQPRHLGFTLACQSILASWMVFSTGSCRDPRAMYTMMLARIAANEVANRPGRIEPRVLKRRRHRYPLMQRPREQLRAELLKT